MPGIVANRPWQLMFAEIARDMDGDLRRAIQFALIAMRDEPRDPRHSSLVREMLRLTLYVPSASDVAATVGWEPVFLEVRRRLSADQRASLDRRVRDMAKRERGGASHELLQLLERMPR